jgi:hypothetical protein
VAGRFVFAITTGRSGTAYLADLLGSNLEDAAVFHERTGWLNFGVVTPDLSDFTVFNSVGNVPKVQAFWKRKLERNLAGPKRVHAEASHLLAKAGLLENIGLLTGQGVTVEMIVLHRDVLATLWSFYNRFDFVNNGLAWAFYLDLAYPNVIVDATPFRSHGVAGRALWYIYEMRVRAAYYRHLMADHAGLRFHSVDLKQIAAPEGAQALFDAMELAPAKPVACPPPRNESGQNFFGDKEKDALARLVARFSFDEEELALAYLRSGRRLANGRRPNQSG